MGKTNRNIPYCIQETQKAYNEYAILDIICFSKPICNHLPRGLQKFYNDIRKTGYGSCFPEYIYKTNKRSNKIPPKKHYNSPCMCCFRNNGRMWMLTGNGNKSIIKNKGTQKYRNRMYYDQLRNF